MYRKQAIVVVITLLALFINLQVANAQSSSEHFSNRVKFVVHERINVLGRQVDCWKDPGRATKAALLCIHGLGLSAVDYEPFAEEIAANGLACYTLNVVGFGPEAERSESEALDFVQTKSNIRATVKEIRDSNPGIPVFLLGESLGGSIALDYAAQYPDQLNGLICSAPTWHFRGEKTIKLRAVFALLLGRKRRVKFLSSPILRRATSDVNLRSHWSTHKDHHLDLSAKEAYRMLSFIRKCPARAKTIDQIPVLFIQGIHDRLGNLLSVAHLVRIMPAKDKSFLLDGTQEHVIFEEGRFSPTLISMLISWMDSRLKKCESKNFKPEAYLICGKNLTSKQRAHALQLFRKAGYEGPPRSNDNANSGPNVP